MFRPLLLGFLIFSFGCASSINALRGRENNQRATFMLTDPISSGQCSGVVVTRDGYILTAGHCVHKNVNHLIVHSRNGNRRITARVIATDSRHDLALLKTDGQTFSAAARLHEGRRLRSGDTIYHTGFPFGGRGSLPQMFGVGHVMNPRTTLDGDSTAYYVLIDLETGRPGASGSGVYDAESGGLIGLVHAIKILSAHGYDRMTLVILIPVEYIRTFLLENGVRVSFASRNPNNLCNGAPEVRINEMPTRQVSDNVR